ncbi:AraC family transcriptional regulator [Bifidobacterium sp. SO4]|uniref:helix-turn-helix domain-containing protein n=1 Tax=Bifidobacterium sp. SO4 TaxID=2809030 RepID=UPI001BDD8489|nr:AraC family transcriptional regulator [Bifidobacterium sp. SO4]MBT1170707.1 helix-turn-helix transcriptional regulator [Bifidobacterium sp. SO4]
MDTAMQGFEEIFCAATGISLWRYDTNMHLEYTNCRDLCWDSVFRSTGCAEQARVHCSQSNRPILVESPLNIFWITFTGNCMVLDCRPHDQSKGENDGVFPTTLKDHCIYSMGPVFIAETSSVEFNRAAHQLDIPDSTLALISEARMKLPVINAVRFEEYAMLMVFAIRRERIGFNDFVLNPFNADHLRRIRQDAIGTHQGSYEYELIMLKDIEDGNVNYRSNRKRMSQLAPTPGKMSVADPLRQTKNMIIVQIATCTRAAIKGGLPSEIAFSMSDSYIQSVEAAHTTVEVQAISVAMYDDYVRAVRKMKQNSQYSDAINRCVSLIRMNTTNSYTLQQLAAEVGYSPYYLSTRFKKETGISINEFTRRAKVDYAQFLLSDTQRSIIDISETLGFSSPSHFIAVFKAVTGITPKRYRNSPQNARQKGDTDVY